MKKTTKRKIKKFYNLFITFFTLFILPFLTITFFGFIFQILGI